MGWCHKWGSRIPSICTTMTYYDHLLMKLVFTCPWWVWNPSYSGKFAKPKYNWEDTLHGELFSMVILRIFWTDARDCTCTYPKWDVWPPMLKITNIFQSQFKISPFQEASFHFFTEFSIVNQPVWSIVGIFQLWTTPKNIKHEMLDLTLLPDRVVCNWFRQQMQDLQELQRSWGAAFPRRKSLRLGIFFWEYP